jgi:hypothetical protein
MKREARLSPCGGGVIIKPNRKLSALLGWRQSSTALRVLLLDDAEDGEEKLTKQLASC